MNSSDNTSPISSPLLQLLAEVLNEGIDDWDPTAGMNTTVPVWESILRDMSICAAQHPLLFELLDSILGNDNSKLLIGCDLTHPYQCYKKLRTVLMVNMLQRIVTQHFQVITRQLAACLGDCPITRQSTACLGDCVITRQSTACLGDCPITRQSTARSSDKKQEIPPITIIATDKDLDFYCLVSLLKSQSMMEELLILIVCSLFDNRHCPLDVYYQLSTENIIRRIKNRKIISSLWTKLTVTRGTPWTIAAFKQIPWDIKAYTARAPLDAILASKSVVGIHWHSDTIWQRNDITIRELEHFAVTRSRTMKFDPEKVLSNGKITFKAIMRSPEANTIIGLFVRHDRTMVNCVLKRRLLLNAHNPVSCPTPEQVRNLRCDIYTGTYQDIAKYGNNSYDVYSNIVLYLISVFRRKACSVWSIRKLPIEYVLAHLDDWEPEQLLLHPSLPAATALSFRDNWPKCKIFAYINHNIKEIIPVMTPQEFETYGKYIVLNPAIQDLATLKEIEQYLQTITERLAYAVRVGYLGKQNSVAYTDVLGRHLLRIVVTGDNVALSRHLVFTQVANTMTTPSSNSDLTMIVSSPSPRKPELSYELIMATDETRRPLFNMHAHFHATFSHDYATEIEIIDEVAHSLIKRM